MQTYIIPRESRAKQMVTANGNDAVSELSKVYAARFDETSTANVTYIGLANPGSLPAAAVWRVLKLDESSGLIITYADGNSNFDNIWDNRTSLTYS